MVPRNNKKFALVMANAGFTHVLRDQTNKQIKNRKTRKQFVTVISRLELISHFLFSCVVKCVQLPLTVISVEFIFSF